MARESKKAAPPVRRIGWRLWAGLLLLCVLGVSTGMAALKVRSYLHSGPQFRLSKFDKDAFAIEGLQYASRSKVQRVFAGDFDRSVFAVPLAERRRRLLAVNWIEDASVSRIWPDRLVVRVRERKPVAFVYFRAGVLLIDIHGVLLEPPPQAQFAFPVLSGLREQEPETDREERVRAMMRVQESLGYMAKDISEVNAADLDNLRLVAKVDNRTVELLIGDTNFGRRYRNFLNHYPEIQKQSPGVKTFDLRLDDRITAKD